MIFMTGMMEKALKQSQSQEDADQIGGYGLNGVPAFCPVICKLQTAHVGCTHVVVEKGYS